LEPEIKHIFADGLYAKEAHIPAGMMVFKHVHEFTHFSILAKGSVVVRVGDSIEVYDAPACIEIKANVEHDVTAVTDVTWYCVHATDEKDESKVDEVLITKRG
jgi:quercetin dioxygenase-like cupin family protein